MKKELLFVCVLFFFFSCKKESKLPQNKKQFVVYISTTNTTNNNKVFLQKLNAKKHIDTSFITNNHAIFKGKLITPERYLLTVDGFSGSKILILENDSIYVNIKDKDVTNAKIKGSILNDELNTLQKKSAQIYSEINLLFPDLQRARLENNASKLLEISSKIKKIEQKNIQFYLKYAQNHPNSFISPMILNDLCKNDSISIKKIHTIYNSFSSEVKKNSDAQNIAEFLEKLH